MCIVHAHSTSTIHDAQCGASYGEGLHTEIRNRIGLHHLMVVQSMSGILPTSIFQLKVQEYWTQR